MVTVVTRQANGIPLTHEQVDNNFTALADGVNNVGADIIAEATAAKNSAANSADAAAVSANSASNSADAASISRGNAAASAEQAAQSVNSLSGPTGAEHIGWKLYGHATAPRTVSDKLSDKPTVLDYYANGVDGPKVDPTGVIDSTKGIQAALDDGVGCMPDGRFKFSETLVWNGKLNWSGNGPGRTILEWHGPITGSVIHDSSRVDPEKVNLDYCIEGIEVACNSYSNNSLYGIRAYRTGRCQYKNLYIHDVGGSLLLWGVSQADTKDVLIENCIFERAYNGDGAQGIGRRVVVRDCYAYGCGDTCYAILYDVESRTNPTYKFASTITFDNCVAEGEYDASGTFTGAGRPTQLGFSFGPFNIDAELNCSIINCTCENLYQNVWMVVFNKLKLSGNTFKQHANRTTGGVRLDGVGNASIRGNFFETKLPSGGDYYCSLLLNAQRNEYGSSIFDASNDGTALGKNTFTNDNQPAIIIAADPTYNTNVADLTSSGNVFRGVNLPYQFKPLISTGTGIFKNINISGDTVDAAAVAYITAMGNPAQYENVSADIGGIGAVPPLSGATDSILVSGASRRITPGVPDSVATTVYTLPGFGFNTIQVQCWVQAAIGSYTAIATIVLNAGSPRIAYKSDGANLSITLSGSNVQVTQSGIGPQTVYSTVKYIS